MADATPATLLGARRIWGVAMDNSQTIAGYKYFVHRETGDRPGVFVAFLDIDIDGAGEVNGVLLPTTDEALALTDVRERNYHRVEVTERIADPPEGPVFAYVGSEAGRARLRHGLTAGTAVVSDAYRSAVESGFKRLGSHEWWRYRDSTEEHSFPVLPLDRVDVPG